MEKRSFSLVWKGMAALVICQATGALGSLFTTPKIASWYQDLIKPSFTPPSLVFAPVWITLFLLMGIALFLILREGEKGSKISMPVSIFGVQLFFNVLWSYLFFGLESPLLGFIGIIILWIAIGLTIWQFFRVSLPAASLLFPYIVWVSLAAFLNFYILILNH
ncbi:MAG: tryptophan-rich sensory protein [Methanomicrobiales archaeon]|nr:tryptophan-rich sensory protein [Methanomicrobiales archaeon]